MEPGVLIQEQVVLLSFLTVSSAYCFAWLCTILLIVIPFVVAYAGGNFWIKEATYREQPTVSFAHDLVVQIDNGAKMLWSTIPELNAHYADNIRVPTIRYRPIDENRDGIIDEIVVTVSMPAGGLVSQTPSNAASVFFAPQFKYQLVGTSRLSMRSLAVVQASTPLPGATSVEFRGHLSLRQRDPLYSGPTRTLYDTTPFKLTADSESLTENSPANLNHILRKYTDRNETTHLEYDVPPVFGFEPSETFDVKLTVRIPNQIISYRPGTAYVLYQAWVQYISFLIPTWFILRVVKHFVYSNQIFPSFVVERQKED